MPSNPPPPPQASAWRSAMQIPPLVQKYFDPPSPEMKSRYANGLIHLPYKIITLQA